MIASPNTSPKQADIIAKELQAHRGQWVSMPRLAEISECMNVHSRISELRANGFVIENRLRGIQGSRLRASFYRLVSEPGDETPATPAPELPEA